MAPKGWKKKTIGDLCEFVNGNGFKASEWSDNGLPIIRIQNLNGSREFNYFAGKPKNRWIVMSGQLLFAWAGTKGVSFGPTIWNGPKGVLNQHIYKVKVSEDVDPIWFYKILRRTTDIIERRAHGFKATLVHVNKSDITDQVVLVPNRNEQSKIAQTLTSWDEAIETTDKLIANSKMQKKVLMQQLLTGRVRFPEFKGKWKHYPLGQLFAERAETGFTNLPLLSITREEGVILRDEVGRKDTSSEDKSKYLRICPGDIGYNTMRMWQGVSALSDKEGIVSPAYTIVTAKNGVSPKFMSYLFKHPRVIHDFYRYSQGLVSDTWNLKYSHFKEVKVFIPKLEEQEKISAVLEVSERHTQMLVQERDRLLFEKKALMQQLLTGKRRVKLDSAA